MPQPKTQKIIKYVAFGLVGLGALSLLIYFFIIRPVQINNQKQNFAKAEASLDALAKQIEEKVGKPDQIKKEKSCDRANLKSSKGPLGCDVSILMQYDNKSASDSTIIMNRTLSLSMGNIRVGSGAAQGSTFVQHNPPRGKQIFYSDLPSISNLTCAISYGYPLNYTITPGVEAFTISISCGGPAKIEFYPLKD